ncbi:MAG: hypothetical protein PSV35_00320, partial [bacterium]|nr:hypothetical protein [bacterium]
FYNSGVDLSIHDGSKDSVFKINDNDLTLLNQGHSNSATPVDLQINALSIVASNQSSITIDNLDGNNINLDVNTPALVNSSFINGINILLQNPKINSIATLVLNSMANNRINLSSKIRQNGFIHNPSQIGVAISVDGSSTISQVGNNQILSDTDYTTLSIEGFALDEHKGFRILSDYLTIQDVVNNRVTLNTTNEGNAAMQIQGHVNFTVNNVSYNKLKITVAPNNGPGQIVGLLITTLNPNAHMAVSNINNNYVTIPIAPHRSSNNGIEIDMPTQSGILTVTNVLHNYISLTPLNNYSHGYS